MFSYVRRVVRMTSPYMHGHGLELGCHFDIECVLKLGHLVSYMYLGFGHVEHVETLVLIVEQTSCGLCAAFGLVANCL